MKILLPNLESLFNIASDKEFETFSLQVFRYQYNKNKVYREFVDLLNINPLNVKTVQEIPFLPISFFKSHSVTTDNLVQVTFKSSGTSGQERSQHQVLDVSVYEKSFRKGFQHFYGNLSEFTILGLLPSYLEQGDSSLVYMIQGFISTTKQNGSGFYLNNFSELNQKIKELESQEIDE